MLSAAFNEECVDIKKKSTSGMGMGMGMGDGEGGGGRGENGKRSGVGQLPHSRGHCFPF